MRKKVSADTISEVTLKSGFSPDKQSTPPTTEELIQTIRDDFKKRIKHLEERSNKASQGKKSALEPQSAFEISLSRTRKHQQKFEEMLSAGVPKGFKLTPVLYSKITKEENARTWKEFSKKINRPFRIFLAENHAHELEQLGICKHGISRMRKGLDPASPKGKKYDVNVDHIVERSGGGNLSLERSHDELNKRSGGAAYKVNHFNNFVLIPKDIHELKNTLNDIQGAALTEPGKGKWVLMLVPENIPGFSGFVATAQSKNQSLDGVKTVEKNIYDNIGQAGYLIHTVHTKIRSIVPQSVPDEQGKYNKNLSAIFNKEVSRVPHKRAALEQSIKPKLAEGTAQLKAAFNKASAKDAKPNDINCFVEFYHGRKFRNAVAMFRKISLKEAKELVKAVDDIDKAIAADTRMQLPIPPATPRKKPAGKKTSPKF